MSAQQLRFSQFLSPALEQGLLSPRQAFLLELEALNAEQDWPPQMQNWLRVAMEADGQWPLPQLMFLN